MSRSVTTHRCEDTSRLSGSLRTLFEVGTCSGLTDGQLLERFLRGRGGQGGPVAEAEAAFAALVERHGPMVLKVCASILGDRHDAEDACQATFLVLARRAERIRRGDSVASWLYGVARRIAARARRDLARRRALEQRRLERTAFSEAVSAAPPEPCPEIYEELDRLPEAFRAAIVLCHLEGHSYEQAATLLCCPVGTVQSRLARGRERLRRRLERRGIGIAPAFVGIGAGLSARPAAAALSPQLTAAIARAALGVGLGRTIAAAAPAAVAAMAEAELRRQVMSRLATMVTTLLVAGMVATAGVGLAAGGRGADPQARPSAPGDSRVGSGPIHVRVVDLDGGPAAGVSVELRTWDQPPRSFTTDADGRATIPRDLLGDRGGFLIARRAREALAWARADESQPNRPSGAEDDPIVMQLLTVDHRVEGSVVDQQGRPVAGVEMRLFALTHPTNGGILFEAVVEDVATTAVTDRAGRFAIQLPRRADANLISRHRRYFGPEIHVAPGGQILQPATLEPAGSIVGRVIDAATGRLVAGAYIGASLIESRSRFTRGASLVTASDDRGQFVLGGAEPGVFNVLFHGVPGRQGATARAVEGVRVRAGADTTADLTAIEGRPLRGVVVDRETGEPVPGTRVGCYGPARPRSGVTVESHRTDERGHFTFYVPPGEQYVHLQEGDTSSPLARQTIVVPEQGEIELVRLKKRSVSDRVMLADLPRLPSPAEAKEDLGPPTKAVAKVAITEEVKTAGPDVGKAMRKAEVYMKAVRPDMAKAKARREPEAPADAPKVRTVTGHVRDPQGRPLAGVRLAVAQGVRTARELPMTDRDGMFLYPELARAPLTIALSRPGYEQQLEDLPADRDEVDWTFNLVPDAESKYRPGPPSDEPIPPELRGRLTFVALDPRGTDDLIEGPGGAGNDLSRLPRGIHKLGETYFRIGEEMIHVRGQMRQDLPQAVKGITVRARGRVLHFLHATQYASEEAPLIGTYVVHYADGSSASIPLVYGRALVDWWQRPDRKVGPTGAKVAWTGANESAGQIRLFDLAWTNPHPEKEITSLDVLSADKECDPFLVAVTVVSP
jgi:RNA polymerase sigma factor (sigma-70 family)